MACYVLTNTLEVLKNIFSLFEKKNLVLNSYTMNTLKDSAIIVLERAKKPLHYKEITRLALEQWLFETSGKTPEMSINSQIILDIKHKWISSDFIKTSPSTYAINPNRKILPKKEEKYLENEEMEQVKE